MKGFQLFLLITCVYVVSPYSYRRNCRRNHRHPMPYPFPFHLFPRVRQYPQQIVPRQHVRYVIPEPAELRYFHIDNTWDRIEIPRPIDIRIPVNPVVPNPRPIIPDPVIPVPVNPAPVVPNPRPIIPDPVIPGPDIPAPVVPTVPQPVIPDPGPDPSRVDASAAGSDVAQKVLQQNSAGPDGIIPISNLNGGFPILSEAIDGIVKSKNCKAGNKDASPCSVGEQCIFADVVNKMFLPCLEFPSVPCQCQPGCLLGKTFIPYGQSAVDNCGNKCSCMNMYGEIDCGKNVSPCV